MKIALPHVPLVDTKDICVIVKDLKKGLKGQLISECPLDVLNFPKKRMKKFDKFLP